MTDNIVNFTGCTTLDIPVETVLNAALSNDLHTCVILGYTQDDHLFIATTTSKKSEIAWLLQQGIAEILEAE